MGRLRHYSRALPCAQDECDERSERGDEEHVHDRAEQQEMLGRVEIALSESNHQKFAHGNHDEDREDFRNPARFAAPGTNPDRRQSGDVREKERRGLRHQSRFSARCGAWQ